MVTLQTGKHPGEAMEAHMYPLGQWEHSKSHLLHAFRNRVGFCELFVFICSEEPFKIVFYCDKGSTHWEVHTAGNQRPELEICLQ